MKIDVSFVMTVYNKEYYLPSVLHALKNQTGVKNPEFIFVDDVSSDKSVEIIINEMDNIPNVNIVINDENMGISPNTNKAIMLARGEYIRMLDSDDILPLNSTEIMLNLAKKHNADMVYGNFYKTGKKPRDICNEKIDENPEYKYSKNALMTVLKGRFLRMGQLIKCDVLQKAGGADERIFIQDESLPIRCAINADGIIKMKANVVLVPEEIGNFSGNKTQLNADRFLAYYFTIMDNLSLDKDALKLMYQRAISAYWKEVRKTSKLPYLSYGFFLYMKNKFLKSDPDITILDKMKKYFDDKKGFRTTKFYVTKT